MGDGSPHARGQREGEGFLPPVFMGVGSEQGGRGWVPACARTTGGDGRFTNNPFQMAVRGNWGWVGSPVFMGVGSEQGGRGWVSACARTTEGGGLLPPVFMGVGCERRGRRGWVPACARTTGGGGLLPPVFMGVGCEQGGRGWVPACARTTGRGVFPPASLRAWVMSGKTGGYRHI